MYVCIYIYMYICIYVCIFFLCRMRKIVLCAVLLMVIAHAHRNGKRRQNKRGKTILT